MKVIGAMFFKRTSLPTSDTNQKKVRKNLNQNEMNMIYHIIPKYCYFKFFFFF